MTVGQGGVRGRRLRRTVVGAVAVALWAGPLGAVASADPEPPAADRPGAPSAPAAPPGTDAAPPPAPPFAAPSAEAGPFTQQSAVQSPFAEPPFDRPVPFAGTPFAGTPFAGTPFTETPFTGPGAGGAGGVGGAQGPFVQPGAVEVPGVFAGVTPQPGVSALPSAEIGDPELVRLALDIAELRPAADAARVLAERQTVQAAELRRSADALAAERAAAAGALQDGEQGAAQLASSDYRGQGLSGFVRLLLTGPAALVPDGVPAAGARAQADLVQRLRDGYAEVSGRQAAAERAAQEAGAAADATRASGAELERRLTASVARLAELARVKAAPGGGPVMVRPEDAAALPEQDAAPTEAGAKAIAEALAQLGRPYVWGGAGPDVFDCSGLTSWAWRAAGRPIPRTSQEQWAGLTRVPLPELRPGDLVIYDPGATHVSMYLGGGLVVHAPHPKTVVKIAPIGLLPVLGAVRPDAAAPAAAPQD
ncbi:NlpC/P60 family protein [Kitasatospora sp. NPDC096147]|uniref:C40 family peptidase n=1 Tax=Kitasatospora sp. NPDC096147 TaxID=3364093 RepID=UPI0037F16C1C